MSHRLQLLNKMNSQSSAKRFLSQQAVVDLIRLLAHHRHHGVVLHDVLQPYRRQFLQPQLHDRKRVVSGRQSEVQGSGRAHRPHDELVGEIKSVARHSEAVAIESCAAFGTSNI